MANKQGAFSPRRRASLFFAFTLSMTVAIMLMAASFPFAEAQGVEIPVRYTSVIPRTDGVIDGGEWDDAVQVYETKTELEVYFKYDDKNLYVLIVAPSTSPSVQDYVGLEFDNTGDAAHMGSEQDPDDAVLVSSSFAGNHAQDAYLKGFEAPHFDAKEGGTNDWQGIMAHSDGSYIVELTRALSTGDTAGFDVDFASKTSVNVAFVYGEFGRGASHKATDAASYKLVLSQPVPSQTTEPTPVVKQRSPGELGTTWAIHVLGGMGVIVAGLLVALMLAAGTRDRNIVGG